MSQKTNHQALENFGLQVKFLREKKNLTLRELSHSCNIDFSKIGKIERGLINVTFRTIIEIAKALDVHPKKLMDFDVD